MLKTKTFQNAVLSFPAESRDWFSLPRTQRQHLIQGFYASGSTKVARKFVDLIKAPQGYGVYASGGHNYEYAVFGRDSIQFAQDVLPIFPKIGLEIILLLARLQGTATNNLTEEEPGKIHHELRLRYFNDQPISASASAIFDELAAKRGGYGDEFCYYGSVDATPLFVCLVRDYCRLYGDSILAQPVTRRDGVAVTLLDCVRSATNWVASKVMSSEWSLLEFKRLNPNGLPYQAWKDSDTGYLHLDGKPANADGGIASVEAQGYAFDALYAAAEIAAQTSEEADNLRGIANKLRDATLAHMWMPYDKFFAVGLDRDDSGSMRQIATHTSNAGRLLESDMWSTLEPRLAQSFIAPVATRLTGSDFLTDAGVRSRSLEYRHLLPFTDYHGSQVTWPCDTFAIARGLAKQGYKAEATDLEDRMLSAVAKAGEFYEFFMVNEAGHVKHHYRAEDENEPALAHFNSPSVPEPAQAWTISAVINCIGRRQGLQPA